MEQPFIMLRTWATSGVTDGIKVEGASSINNVTGEWNSSNVDEIKQRRMTYCTDSIKEERDSPDMDTIRESFTCDRNAMKEDTYNYMNDMKEEGIRHIINNIRENDNYDNIDIHENMVAQYMRNIGEGCTFDNIDIKEEGVCQNMDDIGEDFGCDDIDIKEEGMSQNMDGVGENCSCDDVDIKEEDTSVSMDDIKEGISYNIGATECQEQHEAHKEEMTGNLSLKKFPANS